MSSALGILNPLTHERTLLFNLASFPGPILGTELCLTGNYVPDPSRKFTTRDYCYVAISPCGWGFVLHELTTVQEHLTILLTDRGPFAPHWSMFYA